VLFLDDEGAQRLAAEVKALALQCAEAAALHVHVAIPRAVYRSTPCSTREDRSSAVQIRR
jgi:hypothetical protein